MCGIIFALYSDERSKEYILNSVDSIKHRGPENTNVIDDEKEKYILGFHRLKIIGAAKLLSKGQDPCFLEEVTKDYDIGNQPFITDNYTFACNGEIYNYKALTNAHNLEKTKIRSDVEIIAKLLEIDIEKNNYLETFNKIDGDFAFIFIYKNKETSRSKIIIARDKIGLCPLYYGLDKGNNIIGFASEVKALIKLPWCSKIKQFPPGHYICEDFYYNKISLIENEMIFKNYNISNNVKNASTVIRVLVESAVIKRLNHSDRPVGVLCSGGIDSSIVSAIANRYSNNIVNIFTISYKSGMSYDAFYATKLCSSFKNSRHTNIIFTKEQVIDAIENVIKVCETSDYRTIRAAIPGYLLAKYISENTDIKVILSGEISDELFAGYRYFQYVPDSKRLEDETTRLVDNLHCFDLLRAERVFSAFGLELRVPFGDQNLIEGVKCFNDLIFNFRFKEKYLLREAFRNYPELVDVIDRQKECFSDGCGYDYVPDLLRINSDSSRLDEKEKAEKEYYLNIFEKYYGECSWIIERTMPNWIPKTESNQLLQMV